MPTEKKPKKRADRPGRKGATALATGAKRAQQPPALTRKDVDVLERLEREPIRFPGPSYATLTSIRVLVSRGFALQESGGAYAITDVGREALAAHRAGPDPGDVRALYTLQGYFVDTGHEWFEPHDDDRSLIVSLQRLANLGHAEKREFAHGRGKTKRTTKWRITQEGLDALKRREKRKVPTGEPPVDPPASPPRRPLKLGIRQREVLEKLVGVGRLEAVLTPPYSAFEMRGWLDALVARGLARRFDNAYRPTAAGLELVRATTAARVEERVGRARARREVEVARERAAAGPTIGELMGTTQDEVGGQPPDRPTPWAIPATPRPEPGYSGVFRWQVVGRRAEFAFGSELVEPDADLHSSPEGDWTPADGPDGAWKLVAVSDNVGYWQRLLVEVAKPKGGRHG